MAYVKLAALQFQQLRMKEMAKADAKPSGEEVIGGSVLVRCFFYIGLGKTHKALTACRVFVYREKPRALRLLKQTKPRNW